MKNACSKHENRIFCIYFGKIKDQKRGLMLLHITMAMMVWICTCVPVVAQDKMADLDALMSRYEKLYRFNGTVLVADNKKIVLQKGYGLQNAVQKTRAAINTIYQVGSVTKQFTAALVLKLQEQKKLSVTDKLSRYFPSFPNGDKITLHHLLNHTSGIYNYTDDAAFMSTETGKHISQEGMIALFKDKPLDFEPGTKWNYSNSGYMLLGYIIEKVTGKSYYQVFRENILRPLQMTQSGFDFANLQHVNKAIGYNVRTETNIQPAGIVDSSVTYAAGALYTTVPDLYKWARALASKSKILRPASWLQACTPGKNNYGYGLGIDSLFGEKAIAHSGGIFGFNSNLLVIPAKGITVIMIANVANGELENISRDLVAVLLGRPYKIPDALPPAIVIPAQQLKPFEGEYEMMQGFTIKVYLKGDVLMAEATGQPPFQLIAEKPNFFRVDGVGANLEFIAGPDNKTEKMILHQGGRKSELKKIK
jgi:CubicO group peptidase (beta-lactamase class C family)